MVEEHLNAIRSKEEAAGRLVREAEAQAAAIIDAARDEGEQKLEQVRTGASERQRALFSEARKRAEETILALRADNKRILSALENIAGEYEEQALEIILDSFQEEI
jgi:vacuolar-type H+-ATPase subunit H